jgi:hypothetical protein
MTFAKSYTSWTALFGLVAATGAYAQISSINSANVQPRFFNDMPAANVTVNNSYPGSIQFTETGVTRTNSGGLNRAVWYFSNNGGTSPYQFHINDYFNASFSVTLNGGTTGVDLEAGFLFSNPSGHFGGDSQLLEVGQGGNAGTVVQFGGPSYYPFSPAAGGYPGKGGSVPNYANGQTYSFHLIYTFDKNTGLNAFEYVVNGQYAASAPGDNYFDIPLGNGIGNAGDFLGGYFQIGNSQNNPNNGGTALFSHISIVPVAVVPEPSTLALLALGALPLVLRRRR